MTQIKSQKRLLERERIFTDVFQQFITCIKCEKIRVREISMSKTKEKRKKKRDTERQETQGCKNMRTVTGERA